MVQRGEIRRERCRIFSCYCIICSVTLAEVCYVLELLRPSCRLSEHYHFFWKICFFLLCLHWLFSFYFVLSGQFTADCLVEHFKLLCKRSPNLLSQHFFRFYQWLMVEWNLNPCFGDVYRCYILSDFMGLTLCQKKLSN